MRLTLDWDDDKAMMENLERAKNVAENRGGWELRQSSSGDGYHFIAYGAVNDTESAYRNLLGDRADDGMRAEFGDDLKRVKLDRKRWAIGSPFQQVLYSRKYMSRADRPPYDSGNVAETINGYNVEDEEDKIKGEEGDLDYQRALEILTERMGYTYGDIAEKTELKSYRDEHGGRSESTVGAYKRGERTLDDPGQHPVGRVVRRLARSNEIGHYQDDESRDDKTIYRDGRTRRVLVEYVDVPWGGQPEGGDEGREYKLAQVETGTVNGNHTDRQLRYVHEKAVKRVLDRLSPTSPKNGVTLNLDRDLKNADWGAGDLRQPDAVHYEEETLDSGEAAVYWGNMPNLGRVNGDEKNHVTVEVLLWDQDLRNVEWHVLAVDDGDGWGNHTVLEDTRGWW